MLQNFIKIQIFFLFFKILFFQDLLERFNSDKPASKVKFDRRRAALDSDED